MPTWNLDNWAIRDKRTAKPETCCWCHQPIEKGATRYVDSKQVRHAHQTCHCREKRKGGIPK